MVRHADLRDARTASPQLDQQLGREKGTARLHAHPFERLTPEQLACTVHVADGQPEEDEVRQPVGARVQGPDRRIGSLQPVADDGIRAIGLEKAPDEPSQIEDPELAVTIGEAHELET